MQIILAGLASFGYLGLISDPLIVFKFHNETHDPKGQENKIYTIVKGRETFYHRHIVPITSCSEVKCVLKKVILWKQRMHQKSETRVCKFSGPHQLPSNSFKVPQKKSMIPNDKKIKVWIRFFICWTISKMGKKWPTPISVHYSIFFYQSFFQISYMDCFD